MGKKAEEFKQYVIDTVDFLEEDKNDSTSLAVYSQRFNDRMSKYDSESLQRFILSLIILNGLTRKLLQDRDDQK